MKIPTSRIHPFDKTRLSIVLFILVAVVATNVIVNLQFAEWADHFPFIGVAVWVALLLSSPWRSPNWRLIPETARGSVFLLALVTCASLMPVEKLPTPTWQTTLLLGFVSAIFDNIPLTALAIKQGGYDWAILAYAVGFGGSMIWFGSSSGVAISNIVPEAKSVGAWIKNGWHVVIGYIVGFLVMVMLLGWRPEPAGSAHLCAPDSCYEALQEKHRK